MHNAETPHTQTPLRHLLLKVGPQAAEVAPHLQSLRATQVSVVKVHAGLHNAEKRIQALKHAN